jgi:hypothetical protein
MPLLICRELPALVVHLLQLRRYHSMCGEALSAMRASAGSIVVLSSQSS